MHLAYQQADITIIPTITVKALPFPVWEVMATENAVIATNVGGLTDLIINGLNGLLIEPNGIELKKALETLIGNPELRHDLGQNARNTVERGFTLDLWRSHWLSILRKMLPAKTQRRAKTVKILLVFPYTGIPWEGIKQRPHHIANEFVERGYEIFWGDPAGRRTPAPHIHLLNFNDELYLEKCFDIDLLPL